MFAKTETRLSARVTKEEDWQTDVPNIKLSRAFVVVLVMHFVVIGAVTAFTIMNSDDEKDQPQADTQKEAGDKSAAVASAKDSKRATTTKEKDSGYKKSVQDVYGIDDMRRHIVHPGDSVDKIASQYNVKPEDIYAVNRINELYRLYDGRVIRIPMSASDSLRNKADRMESTDPSPLGTNMVKADDEKKTTNSVNSADLIHNTDSGKGSGPISIPDVTEETEKQVDRSDPIVVDQGARDRVKDEVNIVMPDDRDRRKAEVTPPPAPKQKVYVVKKSDNAFRIAKKYGMKYQELLSYNGLSETSPLGIGQRLKIPN